jgi:hypothetical protein
VEVVHLITGRRDEHRLHPAARVDGERLAYDREDARHQPLPGT